MAHFIILNQFNEGNAPGEHTFTPTLFNLDSVDLIEPVSSDNIDEPEQWSFVQFRWGSRVKVAESLSEILQKSYKSYKS